MKRCWLKEEGTLKMRKKNRDVLLGLFASFVLFGCNGNLSVARNEADSFSDQISRSLVVIGETTGAGSGLGPVADGAYHPQTRILDHQRIGLDLQEMAEKLDSLAFEDAFSMYKEGGHSASVATIVLSSPFPTAIQDRSIVLGVSEAGGEIRGDVPTGSPAQTTTINVAYPVNEGGPNCFVGGKTNPVTEGCFVSSQSLSVAGYEVSDFTYNLFQDTKNLRTLQRLATDSEEIYRGCETCPLKTYLKYVSFYGDFEYADDMILAAFQQASTNLDTANVDFGGMSSVGRGEVIRQLSLNLVIWMAVVGMMEYGIETCRKKDPTNYGISSWDSAVGYYIGVGNNSSALLYDLADELCPNFGTCDDQGTSAVNRAIMEKFQSGQELLSRGGCEEVEETKNRILSLMTVPLIQGTLYYSHLLRDVQDDQILGAAYAFVAAILPLLNDCDSEGVGIIFNSVQIPSSDAAVSTDFFPLVRGFIEEQYECLGLSCQDIGGLVGADLCTGQQDDDGMIGDDDETSSAPLLSLSRMWFLSAVLAGVSMALCFS